MRQPTASDLNAEPYSDRKRYAWLLSMLVPCAVGIGPALMLVSGQAWTLWLPAVFFYGLATLIDRATAIGKRQMVAVIGDSANKPSIGLHEAMGFRMVGIIEGAGYKRGRWVDTVLMQRALGPGAAEAP